MKNKFVLIFSFIAVFSSAFLTTDIINEKLVKPLTDVLETTENTEQDEYRYRVSVFNGKLAIFEGDSKIPYKVYDTYINHLPEEDKKILTSGIRVNSSSELMKIIEEYTS